MKLSKKQIDKLMWYFKDGVRTADNLSEGQRDILQGMRLYENMDTDIDNQLKYFSEHGY
jgi:hypothetical protein